MEGFIFEGAHKRKRKSACNQQQAIAVQWKYVLHLLVFILSFKTSSVVHPLHVLSPPFQGKKDTDIGLTANEISLFIYREVQKKKWSLGLMQFLDLHLLESDPQVNRYNSIYYLHVLGCSRFCIADKTGFFDNKCFN